MSTLPLTTNQKRALGVGGSLIFLGAIIAIVLYLRRRNNVEEAPLQKFVVAEGDDIKVTCKAGERYEISGPVRLRAIDPAVCGASSDITAEFKSLLKDEGQGKQGFSFVSAIPAGMADPCPHVRKEIVGAFKCYRA